MPVDHFIALAGVAALSLLAGCSRNDPDARPGQGSGELGKKPEIKPAAALKQPKDEKACRECEQSSGCAHYANVCDTFEGPAGEGPRAGTSKKELCQALAACAERTGCASQHISRCYCGDTEGTECLEGAARGACKAEVEAALEATDPGVVAVRFDQDVYAGSMALRRFWCLHEKCEAQCF